MGRISVQSSKVIAEESTSPSPLNIIGYKSTKHRTVNFSVVIYLWNSATIISFFRRTWRRLTSLKRTAENRSCYHYYTVLLAFHCYNLLALLQRWLPVPCLWPSRSMVEVSAFWSWTYLHAALVRLIFRLRLRPVAIPDGFLGLFWAHRNVYHEIRHWITSWLVLVPCKSVA